MYKYYNYKKYLKSNFSPQIFNFSQKKLPPDTEKGPIFSFFFLGRLKILGRFSPIPLKIGEIVDRVGIYNVN